MAYKKPRSVPGMLRGFFSFLPADEQSPILPGIHGEDIAGLHVSGDDVFGDEAVDILLREPEQWLPFDEIVYHQASVVAGAIFKHCLQDVDNPVIMAYYILS